MTLSADTAQAHLTNARDSSSGGKARRHIVDVVATAGLGGFFFDDQVAIRAGAGRDGYDYLGTPPTTPGYLSVREPAEATSVMLVLDDGYVAIGDCASVQYSGISGRDPRLNAVDLAAAIEAELAPKLQGLDVSCFRDACELTEPLTTGEPRLGRSAAYGLSQALLSATAHAAGHHIMGRVIKDEWDLPGPLTPVPLYAQTGEDRHQGVDKMVLKQVPVLPHGLINTPALVGPEGEILVAYVQYIRDRVEQISRNPAYLPAIHLDVYGMIGVEAGGSLSKTADILLRLESAAGKHPLRIEHPIEAGGRDAQIDVMRALRSELTRRGSSVLLIADEWANTVDDIEAFVNAEAVDLVQIKTPDLGSIHNIVRAVTVCKAGGLGSFIGGSCTETELSSRATTHVGMAAGATQMLAKPGMGYRRGIGYRHQRDESCRSS